MMCHPRPGGPTLVARIGSGSVHVGSPCSSAFGTSMAIHRVPYSYYVYTYSIMLARQYVRALTQGQHADGVNCARYSVVSEPDSDPHGGVRSGVVRGWSDAECCVSPSFRHACCAVGVGALSTGACAAVGSATGSEVAFLCSF